jgi:hypothetical protein
MCTAVWKWDKNCLGDEHYQLSRIHENGQFPNSCKEDDFLGDV